MGLKLTKEKFLCMDCGAKLNSEQEALAEIITDLDSSEKNQTPDLSVDLGSKAKFRVPTSSKTSPVQITEPNHTEMTCYDSFAQDSAKIFHIRTLSNQLESIQLQTRERCISQIASTKLNLRRLEDEVTTKPEISIEEAISLSRFDDRKDYLQKSPKDDSSVDSLIVSIGNSRSISPVKQIN